MIVFALLLIAVISAGIGCVVERIRFVSFAVGLIAMAMLLQAWPQ